MSERVNDRVSAVGRERVPSRSAEPAEAFTTTELVCLLLAIDGPGLGGAVLDHPMHDVARQFSDALQCALPEGAPQRRVPVGVSADRLIGGVDLAATLHRGRVVAERGVLAAAHGGVVVLPMSERATVAVRTTLCEVLDHGALQVARDGVAERHDARVVALLLDESVDDEFVHPALVDRLAFRLVLEPVATVRLSEQLGDAHAALRVRIRDARQRVTTVTLDDAWLDAMCQTADLFGVSSVRATMFAVRCARAHAALCGRLVVNADDAEVAARLVLAPRATRVPPMPQDERRDPPPESEAPPPPPSSPDAADDSETPPEPPKDGGEILRDAIAAALPAGLLAQLLERANSGSTSGRVGAEEQNLLRGRPRGARGGLPRGGARLHLLETLRAAAPWQRARARDAERHAARQLPNDVQRAVTRSRVAVRREDFRIRRFIEKTGTTVHFVVDASGSAAVYRLGEAKGAVELLLAESYARRDRVSLLAFRGTTTEVLLPPTRALARAKRVLAALPGGGGTPMAAAIDAAAQQGIATRRSGSAPLVVVLSDGRANIARDGTPGRGQAEKDALQSAKQFAQLNVPAMFVDTSPRGEPMARKLADAMHARYVFLPTADAKALGGLVRTAIQLADGGASRP